MRYILRTTTNSFRRQLLELGIEAPVDSTEYYSTMRGLVADLFHRVDELEKRIAELEIPKETPTCSSTDDA